MSKTNTKKFSFLYNSTIRLFTTITSFVVFALVISVLVYLLIQKKETKSFEEKDGATYATTCENLTKEFEKYSSPYNGRKELTVDFSRDSTGQNSSSAPTYTPTNIQVQGIDESDIVKTDGKIIYAINNQLNIVTITSVENPQNAKQIATIKLDQASPSQLFLYKNKLVVISFVYNYPGTTKPLEMPNSSSSSSPSLAFQFNGTKVSLYNVANPAEPNLEREFEIEGYFTTARLKDQYLYTVSNHYVRDIKKPIPVMKDSKNSYIAEDSSKCNEISILDKKSIYPSITSISTFNLDTVEKPKFFNTIGNINTLYMSHNNIYITSLQTLPVRADDTFVGDDRSVDRIAPAYYTETTVINKFSYTLDKIKPVTSTTFEGQLLNQFSLDEYEDHLRIAGTSGQTFNNTSKNFLYVYDKDLKKVSSIDNLAKNERIYSARFYGKLGVVVTFRQIDPLFVFDLADSKNPKLKGELKIPGYSDYLHFINENTIIGLGKDADANTGVFSGIKLATFDITDLYNPKQLSTLTFGTRGTESEALRNHKAFVYDPKHNLILFPAAIVGTQQPCNISYNANQTGQVVSINPTTKILKLEKEIGHLDNGICPDLYKSNHSVLRILSIGENIITISNEKLKINKINTTFDEIKAVPFSISIPVTGEQIKSLYIKFPETRDYPNEKELRTVKQFQDGDSIYFTFIQNGSGIPILSAKCYVISKNGEAKKIGEYKNGDAPDKNLPREIDPVTCKAK